MRAYGLVVHSFFCTGTWNNDTTVHESEVTLLTCIEPALSSSPRVLSKRTARHRGARKSEKVSFYFLALFFSAMIPSLTVDEARGGASGGARLAVVKDPEVGQRTKKNQRETNRKTRVGVCGFLVPRRSRWVPFLVGEKPGSGVYKNVGDMISQRVRYL